MENIKDVHIDEMKKQQHKDDKVFYLLGAQSTWHSQLTLFEHCSSIIGKYTSLNVLKDMIVVVEPCHTGSSSTMNCFNVSHEKAKTTAVAANGDFDTVFMLACENSWETQTSISSSSPLIGTVNALAILIRGCISNVEACDRYQPTGKEKRKFPDVKQENVMEERADFFCNIISNLLNDDAEKKHIYDECWQLNEAVDSSGKQTTKTNYNCNTFDQEDMLQGNIVRYTVEQKYDCNDCGRKFKHKCSLNNHMVVHTGIKTYECDQCGEKFTKHGSLEMHIRKTHTGAVVYGCDQCGKKFKRNPYLKRHILLHTGVKDYECNQCGKRFTENSKLKRHLRTHTGVRNYECEQCGNKFTESDSLKTHIRRIHTVVKDYACDQCGKKFIERGYLKRHMLVHTTGVKDYECDQCGKKFTKRGSLKIHMLVHTGVKDYACDQCGKTFTERGSLKRHMLVHTGVKD